MLVLGRGADRVAGCYLRLKRGFPPKLELRRARVDGQSELIATLGAESSTP